MSSDKLVGSFGDSRSDHYSRKLHTVVIYSYIRSNSEYPYSSGFESLLHL